MSKSGFINFLSALILLEAPIQAFPQDSFIGFQIPWKNGSSLYSFPDNSNRENKNRYYLTFEGATYPDQNSMLPHFEKDISNNDINNTANFNLHILKTKIIPHEDIKKLDNIYQIPGSFQIKIYPLISRKKEIKHLDLLPLRRNPNTGKIEKLVDFVLEFNSKATSKATSKTNLNPGIITGLGKYVNQSVLASGKWVKIKIKKDGIYKITWEDLMEMGISNPSNPRIFGRGGMLPEENSGNSPDELQENAIWLYEGPDGEFGPNDYLLFYGKGPDKWYYNKSTSMFSCKPHLYSQYSYYFVTSDAGTGKRINAAQIVTDSPDTSITQFDDYVFYEKNVENLIKSGKEWFEPIESNNTHTYSFTFHETDKTSPGKLRIRALARSNIPGSFQVAVNGTSATFDIGAVNIWSYTSDYAKANMLESTFPISSDEITLKLTYNDNGNSDAKTWLDFIEINVKRELEISENQMHFRHINSVDSGNITEMKIKNASSSTRIWDISDLHNIRQIPGQLESNQIIIRVKTDSLREFIAFNNDNFLTPELPRESVDNQNLHSIYQADMVIVANNRFFTQAEELAQLHRDNDNITVTVVTPEQIYNEFSSGSPDISAIRNFMKMLYENAETEYEIPKYLLLFGDGSYYNRSDLEGNTAQILTYQSKNSLRPTQSFVSDDFFGLLDDGETVSNGLVDIGIGRLPVNTEEEAEVIVEKIRNYVSSSTFGPWRNNLCFIGDDEDNNIHMRDANFLANNIDTTYPSFKINKIFLDAFPQSTTPQGELYPDVNAAINNQISTGSLIVNYIGHGNERGLAHERILEASDILSWKNYDKLALFITATCEFSRFDDVEIGANGNITKKESAGEQVLLSSKGGGIGLLSTTRLVYSNPNFILNRNFYKFAFEQDTNSIPFRLGDVLRLTKNISGSGINKRNFTLLGDPALTLGYPKHFVITDTLNGININNKIDTLKALGKVNISGHIEDINGKLLENYNGIVYPSVFDKPVKVKTLGNDGGNTMEFTTRENPIYKGKVSVNEGKFLYSFIVPKDISFSKGDGKIYYYAKNEQSDAYGNLTEIPVYGIADEYVIDNEGPDIALYLNDSLFKNGGITNSNPEILARIFDNQGINTVGNGIGHDITAILDNDQSTMMILNEHYEADLDSYKSGTIRYPLTDIEKGEHSLTLKVWDITNNSSEETIFFRVTKDSKLLIGEFINYPNPFTRQTTFSLEHNVSGVRMEFKLQIFNLSGKLVRTFIREIMPGGFRTEPVVWDGKNENGKKLSGGIYIYRIIVRSSDGVIDEASGKMLMF